MTAQQETLFPEDEPVEVTGADRDHALARSTDPATSHLADAILRRREGDANTIKPGTHRHRALQCFAEKPLIAEDVLAKTGVDGVWKRVSDLKKMGFIAPTGRIRVSRKGCKADILELTEKGRAALAKLEGRRET